MANVIQDKSRAFAIRIINCYKYLDEEKHERIMSSRTDFLSKLLIDS